MAHMQVPLQRIGRKEVHTPCTRVQYFDGACHFDGQQLVESETVDLFLFNFTMTFKTVLML